MSPSPVCVICRLHEATTKDHVPPKGIFCTPRPANLIRVPACHRCNHGASRSDERVRVYLGLQVGSRNEAGAKFYKQALQTLRHNRKLRNEILAGSEPTYLTTPAGVIYDRAFRLAWDSDAHDSIVERTIRGLYYHHFGDVLGNRVSVSVQWFASLTIIEMSEDWSANVLGTGECVYRFGRAIDSPLHSVWIFQFYQAHWAGGYTTPPSREQGERPQIVYRGD